VDVQDSATDMHTHEGLTLTWIIEGGGFLKTEQGDLRLEAGDFVIIPPGEPHVAVADPGTTMTECVMYLGRPDDRQSGKIVR
jgi:quercetin dioxygenase-like cupin family protein